ncbi:MAG: transcriptional repressor [Pseudomonadota bacterium]|nr:transcriptional repressor [Pseudomonadota bacterium]
MDRQRLTKVLDLAEALCRKRGARLTAQRRQVLEIVCAASRPVGAYEILAAMRDLRPSAAPPTVYRALDFLLQQGLVHRLETLHAFLGCNHPEHPHSSQFLICAECGEVTELEDEAIARSLRSAAHESGFRPKHRVVEVIGICEHCVHGSSGE